MTEWRQRKGLRQVRSAWVRRNCEVKFERQVNRLLRAPILILPALIVRPKLRRIVELLFKSSRALFVFGTVQALPGFPRQPFTGPNSGPSRFGLARETSKVRNWFATDSGRDRCRKIAEIRHSAPR